MWLPYAYVQVYKLRINNNAKAAAVRSSEVEGTLHSIFCVMTDKKTTQDAIYSPAANQFSCATQMTEENAGGSVLFF